MPLEVGAREVLDGGTGCFPSPAVPGSWKGTVCRHQPPAGSRASHLGGPLGGVLHHRLAEAIIHVGRHLPLRGAPGPLHTLAGLPAQRHCPRESSPGAGPGRRQHEGPCSPELLFSSRPAVRGAGLGDGRAALGNRRRSRWPRRAELFLGRCEQQRRAGPLRRGPSSTRSGRARSDASREGRALSLRSGRHRARWPRPRPRRASVYCRPRLPTAAASPRAAQLWPPAPIGARARLLPARPPRSWQLSASSVQAGGRARRTRRAGRGSPAGARPRAERAAPPSVCRAATALLFPASSFSCASAVARAALQGGSGLRGLLLCAATMVRSE